MKKLSRPQQAIYEMEMFCGGSVARNSVAVLLDGKCSHEVLFDAIQFLYQNNEILRTHFFREKSEIYQEIQSENQTIPDTKVFSDEAEFRAWADAKAQEPINLFDQVVETIPIRFGTVFGLFLSIHHIISDAWSIALLANQFVSAYKNYSAGEKPISRGGNYFTYIEEEEKYLQSGRYQIDGAYWHSLLLKDAKQAKVSNKISNQFDARRKDFPYSVSFMADLRRFCEKNQLSVYSVFLSAVGICLGKMSLTEHFFIGTTVLNRRTFAEKNTVGMFADTSLMEIDTAKADMKDYLRGTSASVVDMFRHQKYPIMDIRRDHMEQYGALTALYSVLFNYQIAASTIIPEAKMQYFFQKKQIEDICIHAVENIDGSLNLVFNYRTGKFEEWEIEHLNGMIKKMLEDITAEVKIDALREYMPVTAEETAYILSVLNATREEYGREMTVVQRFEEETALHPERIALRYHESVMTYAELNRRANRIAWKLINTGVKPGDHIAVMAQRCPEMVCAVWGILKSGAAYVPVDPAFPENRKKYILEDSGAKSVLTYDAEGYAVFGSVDLEDSRSRNEVFENPERKAGPENTAYVIYTSGTTGKPKGVVLPHRSAMNYCGGKTFGILGAIKRSGASKIAAVTNLCFDIHVTELLLPLANGMEICLADQEESTDGKYFARFAQTTCCEILQTTPGRIRLFMAESGNSAFAGIKQIFLGGEKVDAQTVRALSSLTDAVLFNVYGPTETTVWSSMYEIKSARDAKMIPIGRPVSNTRIYIMQGEALCGIGVAGELCIAGDGVAAGYFNRAALTAERFVNDPYGEGRMYRTGDLARWTKNNIEYFGRMDEQVKISGYRIEPAEVENVLRQQKGVTDAAVVAKDRDGDTALYAYLVTDIPDIGQIREDLRKELPEYMVPSYMMRLEKLPVNQSGKLDRGALPEIVAPERQEYIAPSNASEEMLCEAFMAILGVERIGIKDSFFDLGGHSLTATRLVNLIEEKTGASIGLREVFERQTPAGLAELVRNRGKKSYEKIPEAEKRDFYDMSSAQRRMFVIDRMFSGITYNMPTAMVMEGRLDKEKLMKAAEALVKRHEALRTTFGLEDGRMVQRIVSHADAEIEVERASGFAEELKESLMADFVRPFDLSKAPLMRLKLVEADHNESIMLFDMHHIISDAISLDIVIEEFVNYYFGGEPAPLRMQYKDYSEWMKSRDMSREKEYWLGELSGELPVLEMPLDHARPQMQSFRGRSVLRQLNSALRKNVLRLAKATGTTEYMILLSCMMIVLSKYTGQEDIIIGSPASCRTHPDMEKTLGMFVNTLALRGQPEENKSFRGFLLEIREKCLKAYEHQEYPFELLVGNVKVARDMSRNPIFDVLFDFEDNVRKQKGMHEFSARQLKLEGKTTKFDLDVQMFVKEDGYGIECTYCVDVYEKESVELLLGHFCEVIRNASAAPDEEIGRISMTTKEEKDRIFFTFNDTNEAYDHGKTVVELFEEQAALHKDRPALLYTGGSVTYGALNRRANSLARALTAKGMGPGDLVAVMAQRSPEMVCAVWGIIKAGGAYVPIDPTYPEERKKYILEDSRPKAMLIFRAKACGDICTIDLCEDKLFEGAPENPDRRAGPDDPAYVIYTSGTTGKPKGVMLMHRNVMNYCGGKRRGLAGSFRSCGAEKVAAVTNLCFDIHVTELVLPLANGMTVCLADQNESTSGKDFARFAGETGCEVLQTTPGRIKLFMTESGKDCLKGLKGIFLGGERVSAQTVRELSGMTGAALFDVYGPTETTVWSSMCAIENAQNAEKISIGSPIQNTRIYIMHKGELCGLGVPGEVCIAGDGVSRGYLNRPELTAERFVTEPRGEGRMYRTGDLARWMPDGRIEYLGRMDEQVKIRGFRIEPAEIESVLRHQQDVTDAAVIAKDRAGEKTLFAYLVADEKLDISRIREAIRGELPDYMVPPFMMQLDRLPVTKNGKLDKRALPEISFAADRNYSAPSNDTEKMICEVFGEVLGVPDVGIEDSFLELGGDSFKAIKVIAKMQLYGFDIGIRDIMFRDTPHIISEFIVHNLESVTLNKPELTRREAAAASGEAAVARALDRIEPFNDIFYKDCFYNSLFEVFRFYNKSVVAYLVNEIPYLNMTENGISALYKTVIPLEQYYQSERLHSDIRQRAASMAQELILELDLGRPVILRIDCYYCPNRIDTYRKTHLGHALTVYGYDLERKMFLILEQEHQDILMYQKAEISFADLEAAYYGGIDAHIHSDINTFFSLWSDGEGKYSSMSLEQLRLLYFENVAQNREMIREGLTGIDRLVKAFRKSGEDYDSTLVFQTLFSQLNAVVSQKDSELYLQEILLGNSSVYFQCRSDIAKAWKELRVNMGKLVYAQNYARENLDENLLFLMQIKEKELEAMRLFESTYAGGGYGK
jgi:amino acid adenylation domain-containing protein